MEEEEDTDEYGRPYKYPRGRPRKDKLGRSKGELVSPTKIGLPPGFKIG
jgi:hypothetical protein